MKSTRLIVATATTFLLFSCNKNEYPPEIVNQVFQIEENTPGGTIVGIVEAFDLDGDQILSYEIIEGNVPTVFELNAGSGELTIADSSALDYESTQSFELMIAVSDNHKKEPLETSATVVINLIDLNEFAPEIIAQSFSLYENPIPGQIIGTVQITDREEQQGVAFSILDSEVSDCFSIDPNIGSISVVDANAFNFEAIESYQIEVEVTDLHEEPLSSSNVITININDIVDFEDGILAYYPFKGNALDAGANSLHGELSGDGISGPQLSSDRFENADAAYLFDGVDDYILLPQVQEIHFADNDFSINVWAKIEGEIPDGDYHSIFSAFNSSTGKEFNLGVHGVWDSIYFKQYHQGGSTGDLLCVSPETGWHMITVCKSNNILKMYYDGIEIGHTACSAIVNTSISTKVMIGAIDFSTLHPQWLFRGSIDDLSIHTREITASEIDWMYKYKRY